MEDTAHYDTQTVLKQYKVYYKYLFDEAQSETLVDNSQSVIDVEPKSEEGHFRLGKYYDRLMGFMAKDRPAK